MTKASENQYPKITVAESAAPGTPSSGLGYIYAATDSKLYYVNDGGTSSDLTAGTDAVADQGAFTYLDATEGAAPGTPASGYARIYAKTDGRIYSMDDGGTEYGPFDSGGTFDWSVFRLGSAYKDDPDDLALGVHGDEFEYEGDRSDFSDSWASTNSLPAGSWYLTGSGVALSQDATTSGRGFVYTSGTALPDNFEVAVLMSGYGNQSGNMTALAVTGTAGGGIAFVSNYSGNAYTMTMNSAWTYNSTGASGTAMTVAQLTAPHWLAMRRSSGTAWRCRWSADGTTWTDTIPSRTQTVTGAQCFYVGPIYNGGGAELMLIHRLVYGEPDIGLG